MIGAVIMAHGDDQGLVLPPMLAPYQVVIVPIGRGEQLNPVLAAAEVLTAQLRQAGIRAHVDNRVQLFRQDSSSMTGNCAACRTVLSLDHGI